jgi:hypothetical protein
MLRGAVRCADDLHPLRVLSLFRNIPDEDLDVLDIAGEGRGGGEGWRGAGVDACGAGGAAFI